MSGFCAILLPLKHNLINTSLLFRIIVISCCCLTHLVSTAQKPERKKSFWSNLDSIRAAKIEVGQSLFTPFIAPAFSPELGFLISAGGLYTFKVQKDNPIVERSSIPFAAGLSSNGSVQFNAKLTLYGKDDKHRASGELWFKDMPDNYFGVGYDNAKNTPLSDTTTTYNRTWFRLYYKLLRRFGSHLFWGGVLDINRTTGNDFNSHILADPDIIRTGNFSKNAGLGLSVQYDSRDLIVNAYEGWFLDLNVTFYGRFLGGQSRYEVIDLDYRQYKLVGHRKVLSWQVRSRNAFDEVPWPEMSQLGNPFDLRGYRWGRFRDKSMLFGILEYRHMLGKGDSNKKFSLKDRSGFVTWIGGGSISPDPVSYDKWLPNFGVGYRLETEPRMNIRVDYGFGFDSSFFYISFNEAF